VAGASHLSSNDGLSWSGGWSHSRHAAPTTGAGGGGDERTILRTFDLTKRYPSGTLALDGLSVVIPAGTTGLVGANGAGKTTLFKLMLGQLRPSAGSLEVCGTSVLEDPRAVRHRLGFMPEHDCLPPDQTAADVVGGFGELAGLPPRAARQRASEVLDLVGLDEARFRPVGGFSTGMRQRAKLAQALVADPGLLLLDEPTAGLDPMGREDMLALVARLGSFGISILLSTHLLEDVQQVCDHVVMLDGGTLVEAGPTRSLLHGSGMLRIDVGDGGSALVDELRHRGAAAAVLPGGLVEVPSVDQWVLDLVRDVAADLGLPLHRLTVGHTSLDEVFLSRAGSR
jgi:ABC-2 type transport system ATP-binding protein